jgi:pyruvate formate-lyase activating enzyme-like uncharacterized protein
MFRDYTRRYQMIAADFRTQIESLGLPIDSGLDGMSSSEILKSLTAKGIVVANGGKSLHWNWISPSCIVCRKGVNTATLIISTACPNNCFFCFNPNQGNYEYLRTNKENPAGQLEKWSAEGKRFTDLALTGGEPLLHKPDTELFFSTARRLYPNVYTRLYTSGAFLDKEFLSKLKAAGLDELRFSIKTNAGQGSMDQALSCIAQSKDYVPNVIVEMPVMPDELGLMKSLLVALDDIEIAGINLLELCFPFNNTEEYSRRGYKIKAEQFEVLYDYWYAGGLPVSGSEEVCLELLGFSADENLRIGVHYCSLENKLTGQVYQQNFPYRHEYRFCTMDNEDFFLKCLKAFGKDVERIQRILDKAKIKAYYYDNVQGYIAFPLRAAKLLKKQFSEVELGISFNIVEETPKGHVLRELKIDYTTFSDGVPC